MLAAVVCFLGMPPAADAVAGCLGLHFEFGLDSDLQLQVET